MSETVPAAASIALLNVTAILPLSGASVPLGVTQVRVGGAVSRTVKQTNEEAVEEVVWFMMPVKSRDSL